MFTLSRISTISEAILRRSPGFRFIFASTEGNVFYSKWKFRGLLLTHESWRDLIAGLIVVKCVSDFLVWSYKLLVFIWCWRDIDQCWVSWAAIYNTSQIMVVPSVISFLRASIAERIFRMLLERRKFHELISQTVLIMSHGRLLLHNGRCSRRTVVHF